MVQRKEVARKASKRRCIILWAEIGYPHSEPMTSPGSSLVNYLPLDSFISNLHHLTYHLWIWLKLEKSNKPGRNQYYLNWWNRKICSELGGKRAESSTHKNPLLQLGELVMNQKSKTALNMAKRHKIRHLGNCSYCIKHWLMFAISKSSGGLHPVLNLKPLNLC